jgi:hypothetical protein
MKTLRKTRELYGRLKELVSNPAFKFSYCVNADKTTVMASAILALEDVWQLELETG